MTQNKEVRWVRLGDFIEVADEVNKQNIDLPVMGLNRDKQMMPTVANLDGVNLSKYKIVNEGTFVFSGMQTGRDVCIRIVMSTSKTPVLVSPAYTTFNVKTGSKLIPQYLFMWFDRLESDRYGWFISDSSIRSNLDWPRFIDIKIPIPYKDGEPDVERQQEIVNVWQGLRRLKEENEALAKPLLDLCDAKMDELKHSVPMVELGDFIEQRDERNKDNKYNLDNLQGVSIDKKFIPTKANMEGVKLTPYKLVYPFDFCYVNITSRNGEKITLALNQSNQDYIVSSSYIVFRVTKKNDLDPTFLYLWFCRSEFDRYSRFNSWGSAREAFSWEEMYRVKVPKPSLEVQKAIVDIYLCARRAKEIAAEADKQLKEICPALMQHIIHS